MTWALGGFGQAERGRQRPQGKEGANGKAVERGNRVRGGGRHVWGTSMLQADTRYSANVITAHFHTHPVRWRC